MNFLKSAAAAALVGGVSAANAAAMTLPAEITDAGLSVAVIGLGVFLVAVGIKVFKWVRRAL